MVNELTELASESGSKVASVRPVPDRMAHIVLRTKNVKELAEWYKAVFQCKVIFENEAVVFLAYDSEHHRFVIGPIPDIKDPDHLASGFDHVAFSFDTAGGLLLNYEYLKSIGIEPYWCIDHGVTISIYYRDPDGNQIELQVDRFPDTQSAQRYFQSAAFAENPVGVEFDADQMVQRYHSGESEACLLEPITRT